MIDIELFDFLFDYFEQIIWAINEFPVKPRLTFFLLNSHSTLNYYEFFSGNKSLGAGEDQLDRPEGDKR